MVRKLFAFSLSHLSPTCVQQTPEKDSHKEHIIKIFLSTRVVSIYCHDDEQINNDYERSSALRILRWKSKLFWMSSEVVERGRSFDLKSLKDIKNLGVNFCNWFRE